MTSAAVVIATISALFPIPNLIQWVVPPSGRDGMTAVTERYGRPSMPARYFSSDFSAGVRREQVDLGRRLFSETALSRDGSVSCATCHDPHNAFADDRGLARGIDGRIGERHTPALINRGLGRSQFWDGRVATLEEQVLEPIQNPKEMDLPLALAPVRLVAKGYGKLTPGDLAGALGAYVRTIRSEDSPFDRFVRGDRSAYTAEELRGLFLFRDKANCLMCHGGPNLTDEEFHNTGVAWKDGKFADEGRFKVTRKAYHRGAFKTPTLREIARTAPYMHDGSMATLEDVVEFYDRGGNPNPALDANMRALNLSKEDKRALIAFLRSVSGTIREGM